MNNIIWCTGHQLKINNIVKANASILYDEQGNQYIDLESGIWVVPLGHNHPGINQAITDQLSRVTHCGYYNSSQVVDDAASAILEVTGLKDGKCIFLCSGSEAVECGIQALHTLSGRNKLLCLHDSFLGSYGSASKKQMDEWQLFDWSACRDCPEINRCNPDCHLFSSLPLDQLGGFVFEPGSASGLVRFPPTSFIETLVRLIRRNGGLILVNEVTTGMGRTGQWFGYNHYRFQPDLVALGKGLGNGYPVSALAVSEKAARALEDKSFYYQQSHQNDALGCRVALEVIQALSSQDLINRSAVLGKKLGGMLKNLSLEYELIKEIRGKGLMISIEFKGAGDQPAAQIHDQLFNRGYLVSLRRGHNTLRIDPPLNIDEKHLDNFIAELEVLIKTISG
jgi:acetylornithine/N-succinyldiaminopimelate aminotransferase